MYAWRKEFSKSGRRGRMALRGGVNEELRRIEETMYHGFIVLSSPKGKKLEVIFVRSRGGDTICMRAPKCRAYGALDQEALCSPRSRAGLNCDAPPALK